MTAVVRRDVPLEDLVSRILGICDKDAARVSGILARGSLVSGGERFRWKPLRVPEESIAELLQGFPDHDPQRAFRPECCESMVFDGSRGDFRITAEVGRQKKLFRRTAFWEEVLALVAPLDPTCERYSFSDEADVFSVTLDGPRLEQLRGLGRWLKYRTLESEVRLLRSGSVKLYVRRGSS